MKTKDQIKEWINSHDWAAQYYYNVLKLYHFGGEHVDLVMSHSLGESTISGAFTWSNTPEKHNFWNDIDDEFLAWFWKPEEIVVDEHTSPEILYNLLKVVSAQHGITKIAARKGDKAYVFEA